MKNKKKKKNESWKKYYLLFLLLVTGIVLVSSTYAWFTVNRIVFVEALNVQVEAKGGIEISVDGNSWFSYVNGDDINSANETYPGSINQLPLKIEPVSTGGNIDDLGHLEMYYGVVEGNGYGDYVLSALKDEESEGNEYGRFVAFDIFLRSNQDTDLYLTNLSGASYVGEENSGMENAFRFAFIVLGHTASNSSLDTIQSLNNGRGSNLYIWEPNYDTHSETGRDNAYSVYGIEVNESGNGMINYDGIIANIDRNSNIFVQNANSSNYPNLFKPVMVDYYTETGFTNFKQIFSILSGITKVRVYAWIEGQDVDCENGSSMGNIDFNFQFTTNPA